MVAEITSRRGFIQGSTAAAVVGAAGCTVNRQGGSGATGANFDMGGRPASGGVAKGFAYEQPIITQEDATRTIRTEPQLHAAIDEAQENGTREAPVVGWIPADAAVPINRSRLLEHIILASSRSTSHPGGIIHTSIKGGTSEAYRGGEVDGMLAMGENSRMTGLRYRGPTSNVYDNPNFPGYIPFPSGSSSERSAFYSENHSRGVTMLHGDATIDNCEVFGWSSQGISINCPPSFGSDTAQSYPEVSFSSLHDCMLSSSGYCVRSVHGHAHIYRCALNAARHAVAGFGHPDAGYTIENCVFLPAQSLFPVDMHYIGENMDGSNNPSDPEWRYWSGGLMQILSSTFMATHVIDVEATDSISQGGNPFAGNATPAIVIGGIPAEGVRIQGNLFAHPPSQGNPKTTGGGSSNPPITQGNIPSTFELSPNGFYNFTIQGNEYGFDPDVSIGQGG